MLHPLKMAYVLYHHLAQCALGPFASFDQARHLRANGGIAQNSDINIKQRMVFRVQFCPEIVCHRLNIGPHTIQSFLKSAQLPTPALRPALGHSVKIRRGRHHNHRANGNTRSTGYADHLGDSPLPDRNSHPHRTGNPGMGNNACQLG